MELRVHRLILVVWELQRNMLSTLPLTQRTENLQRNQEEEDAIEYRYVTAVAAKANISVGIGLNDTLSSSFTEHASARPPSRPTPLPM